jgi:hypothetical protein
MNKEDILRAIENLEKQIVITTMQDEDNCVNWLVYGNLVIARRGLLKELECLNQ